MITVPIILIGTRSKLVKYLLKMIWYLLSGKVNSYCFHDMANSQMASNMREENLWDFMKN